MKPKCCFEDRKRGHVTQGKDAAVANTVSLSILTVNDEKHLFDQQTIVHIKQILCY